MQFRLPIQSVQCDNGKEFDNHALGSFFSKYGIVFRFSCLHTSPQNGKAERGIRIITNILCTLLFQGHLPAWYWVEAMHNATYLFNRRPSRPLQRITPYEALFVQTLDYSNLIEHLAAFAFQILVPLLQTSFLHTPLSVPFWGILVSINVTAVWSFPVTKS
jgi:hypothetical protein